MHALRTSLQLSRLVLAWFVLTLGVAVLSPMVHPQAMELVCSSGGATQLILVANDGQAAPAGHHTLDCSACFAATLPPWPVRAEMPRPQPLAHAVQPTTAAHIAALVGAPLPPRGPPAHA